MPTTFQVHYAGWALGCAQLHEHGNCQEGEAQRTIKTIAKYRCRITRKSPKTSMSIFSSSMKEGRHADPMNRLTKGEVGSGGCAAEPVQVLRPADPPVQSLPSGLKQPSLISKLEKKKFSINFTFEIQVRDIAAIYDSYNCGIIWKFGHCRPWPSKRQGFRSPASPNCSSYLLDKLSFPRYVGYGPTKNYAVRALRRKRCPVKCRPEAHKDWEYC